MFDLIKLLFNICQLKEAPQDLPYSANLLITLAISSLFTNFLLLSSMNNWSNVLLDKVFLEAATGVLNTIGFSWVSLFFSRKITRFYQTTAALLGTNTLIIFFILFVGTIMSATKHFDQNGLLVFLVTYALIILMIALIIRYWIITGHIMSNALGESFGFGLGLAFLYLLTSYWVMAIIAS